MQIRLAPDSIPVRVKPRRYSEQQSFFLQTKVKELLDLGLIRRNPSSAWASAPLVVPKPDPEKWRFTTDLRPVNKVTVPHAWPMPDLESVTARLAGQHCFAAIDLCHAYWQLPLHEDSQECQSFITPNGVYSPTRVMHGQRNAVAFCQSSVQLLCESIAQSMLLWLDDMLLYGTDATSLLHTLRKFFEICHSSGLKLHAKKCRLFLSEVKWCGKVIDGKGVRLDPSRLEALLNMPPPSTGDALHQFLCAANWMRSCIPQFTTVTAPLAQLLEKVYKHAGKRTKRAVAKVLLESVACSDVHLRAFDSTKSALANAVRLSHPHPDQILCLFTDASEQHWSGILTQIPPEDLSSPFADQHHSPLAFLSGSFSGSSTHWSTPEKEASGIINSVERLDYLLLRPQGFYVFTDHNNLVFIYNSEQALYALNSNSLNKVRRWGMLLSNFEYKIVHISGEDNCWADLLSRWGSARSHPAAGEVGHLRLAALLQAPLAPNRDADLTWPTRTDIILSQQKATPPPATLVNTSYDGLLQFPTGVIWIPPRDVSLQLRICVIGHCGRGGHRGATATAQAIKAIFFWDRIDADIAQFCRTCLHCALTSGGTRTPRPLGHAMHSDRPNELIHFDFLYLGPSTQEFQYVMIIKDDASLYTWLKPSPDTTSDAAASALLQWFSAFGVVPTWISDQGTHFKNMLIHSLNRALHAHHHFTVPHSPKSNGTVERVCREVLRCCRALLSEFRMFPTQWPHVLPLVQSMLNHTPRGSLGNRAPVTVFSGLPADNPLRLIVLPDRTQHTSFQAGRALKLMNTERLLKVLDEIHKDVSERRPKHRDAAIRQHNEKTGVKHANFMVGDFVLMARTDPMAGSKLKVKWVGPQRVSCIESEWVF